MTTALLILTIVNSLTLVYILTHKKFSISKNKTFFKNTLLGYSVYYKNKQIFYIPIRPEKKTNLAEEVKRMMTDTNQSKYQQLRAMFSWLKAEKEVMQFKKDYEIVDKEFVNSLVTDKLNSLSIV